METITLNYVFNCDDGDTKEVCMKKEVPMGIHDYDVCEMFLDFMRAVGFSEENVFRYFKE